MFALFVIFFDDWCHISQFPDARKGSSVSEYLNSFVSGLAIVFAIFFKIPLLKLSLPHDFLVFREQSNFSTSFSFITKDDNI